MENSSAWGRGNQTHHTNRFDLKTGDLKEMQPLAFFFFAKNKPKGA